MSSKEAVPSPVRWMDDVEDHDYDAAKMYLSLKYGERHADKLVGALRETKLTTRRPNDILRAAGLPALPMADPGVHRDLLKLLNGKALSPVLVAYDGTGNADIADGYHRVSLCYNIDPFMSMPLRVA